MIDKLKPCPFCGGEAETVWLCGMDWVVRCKNRQDCRVETSGFDSVQQAITAWNRYTVAQGGAGMNDN